MTDQHQTIDQGLGQRLKAARKANKLSQKDVATRLHLNPAIIEQIENEDFQKAPPHTFTRGYIRAYGKLLNFAEHEMEAQLEKMGLGKQLTGSLATPIPTLPNKYAHEVYLRYSTIGLLVVLSLFVGIWLNNHSNFKQILAVNSTKNAEIAQNDDKKNPTALSQETLGFIQPTINTNMNKNQASTSSPSSNPADETTTKPTKAHHIAMALPEPGL